MKLMMGKVLLRYGKGQRGMDGEHLYAHFFEAGLEGLSDMAGQNYWQNRF